MKNIILFVTLLFTACGGSGNNSVTPIPVTQIPVQVPVLTLEQKITNLNDGLGGCALWQDHDEGTDLPDCQRIYDAIERSIARATPVYPQATTLSISPLVVHFHRKARHYDPSKPYPLIYGMTGSDTDPQYVRGYTVTSDQISGYNGVDVYYSYEECLEHEMLHVIGWLFDHETLRTPEAIALDNGGYPNWMTFARFPLYLINCHGTSDDKFGVLGNRASCAELYPLPAWSGYKP